jgi:hypothetical protein
MKNPLIPKYRERERAHDKFEMEHHADLQLVMPDFDERLRAHEEKHDPLNEFTGTSLFASAQVTATVTADLTVSPGTGSLSITGHAPTVVVAPVDYRQDVTVELTGVTATAEAGTVLRGKKSWVTEQELQVLIELSKPMPPPDPVPLFEGIASAIDWWPNKTVRIDLLKGLADEAADLQPLIAQGRTALVIWRQVCTWGWVGRELVANVVVPLLDLIAKVPSWLWAFIVWLFTWK